MRTEQVLIPTIQLHWFKSSYSGSGGGDCVEVALAPRTVHIRDSKTVHGPALRVSPERWSAFVSYASKKGEVPA
ncbi:DUF397 domain-containing protein [Streptomyces sp. NPDC006923]|uniref:DUF397 domain-containing protein n=1 Tax=Streptomyces sp. NPDC006923 TaxID=3155355 RepID=UPI0033FCED16